MNGEQFSMPKQSNEGYDYGLSATRNKYTPIKESLSTRREPVPPNGCIEQANKYLWSYDSPLSFTNLKKEESYRKKSFEWQKYSYKKRNKYSHRFPFQYNQDINSTHLTRELSNPPQNYSILKNYDIASHSLIEYNYHDSLDDTKMKFLPENALKRCINSIQMILEKTFLSIIWVLQKACYDKRTILLLVLALVILILLIIFCQQQRSIEETVIKQITEKGISDVEALLLPGSPQFKALKWTVRSDIMQYHDSDQNLYLHYGMAVLYYSLSTYRGSKTWDNDTWLSKESVCHWYGVICSYNSSLSSSSSYGYSIVIGLNLTNVMGTLPRELSVLEKLKWVHLGNGNSLRGTLPSEIGLLTDLMVLSLGNNFLSGSIPSELTALGSLNLLGLQRNNFTSTIPGDIGHLSNLVALYLDWNELSGQIPSSIGSLDKTLVDCRLNNNKLEGSLPIQIGNLGVLQKLYLQSNQLSGSIPNQLSNLTRLRYVNLQRNNLVGQYPNDICYDSHLIQAQIYVDCDKATCSCCKC